MLFSETSINDHIDLTVRFIGFKNITFHSYSLTSKIFRQKPENKRLWLYLIPMRSNLTQIELDDENLTDIEDQFHFDSDCFSGLTVSQLTIYIHTVRDRFPSSYTFEKIFNNTNIGELHFHGSIIRPSSVYLNETFNGLIRSLKLYRHVDIIDANNFPFYSYVYSYTIHSIEAHSMNLSSFFPSHKNLRGLEIIRPRFNVLIDQLIPTLDSLTIDIEDLNEKTLFAARHIYNLKLGPSLRSIDPKIFVLLSRRLHHLDLSDIILSQMKSDSRCHLIKYLHDNYRRNLNIIFPQLENLTECDCSRLFINQIQSNSNIEKTFNFPTCSKLCHLSDCEILREYFKQSDPLYIKESQPNYIQNETIEHKTPFTKYLPSIDLLSDSGDDQMINFLVNQTKEDEKNFTFRPSTTPVTNFIDMVIDDIATLSNIQEYDDFMSLSTPKLFEPWQDDIDEQTTDLFMPNKSQSFSWFSFFIGIGFVLLLIIISLILFLTIQYRKENRFRPLSVYV